MGDDQAGLEALHAQQRASEFLQDPTRSLRKMIAVFVLVVSTIAAMAAILSVVVGVRDGVGTVPGRFLAFQSLASIPFTLAAVLAVISLRAPRSRSWRVLGFASAAMVIGVSIVALHDLVA